MWCGIVVEFEFGKFGWLISRLTAEVSNVRSRRLQKLKVLARGGVEDTKKSEAKVKAKDSLSEDRTSRGQG